MKCLAKDRHNECCRNKQIENTNFCKLHQYMRNYTTEMLEKIELCKGCKKMYYFGDSKSKSCENCRSRDKTKNKKTIVLCKKEGCTFKKSQENGFCGKHQIMVFVEETKKNNKKLCCNYIRGCKSQLENGYSFSKCMECLEKDRIKDNLKRHNVKECIIQADEGKKICSICCIQYDISEYKGKKIETKSCKKCRDQNKKQDKLRDKTHRNLIAKININQSFRSYIKEAKRRNIDFQLSKEDFMNIVKKNCYYCCDMNEEKKFNGIDRIDSSKGYLLENCISCCTLCNYYKNKHSISLFMKRVEHILSYKMNNVQLYNECFPDFISGNYKGYRISAKNRKIDFLLNEDTFDSIIENGCYICGKNNSKTHKNGIDRFDNSIGYIEENCKSCCNTCNMLKNRFSFSEIIEKFEKIMKNRKNIVCY